MENNSLSRILIVLPHDSLKESAVLESQILELAVFLSGIGYQVGIFSYMEKSSDQQTVQDLEKAGITCHMNNTRNILFRMLGMKIQLFGILARSDYDILFFRDIWGGLLASVFRHRKTSLIYNIRAVIAEESAYRNSRKFPSYYVLKSVESFLIRSADRISVVSNKLAEYVKIQSPRKVIFVIPSAVNAEKIHFSTEWRDLVRKQFQISPREILLAYIGGIGMWQMFDSMVNLFIDLYKVDQEIKFLLITTDRETTRTRFPQEVATKGNLILLENVPHDEVHWFLSAADVGLLLRENELLNIVSSPIKFAEYLICGLPVITTPWVGDFSANVNDFQLGLVLGEQVKDCQKQVISFLKVYRSDQKNLRDRCIAFAKENLTWEAHTETIKDLFRF